jgi:hypothetical protein
MEGRPGLSVALEAEQLLGESIFRDRVTIDRDECLARVRSTEVKGTCNELFADSGLATHEDGHVFGHQAVESQEQLTRLLAMADDDVALSPPVAFETRRYLGGGSRRDVLFTIGRRGASAAASDFHAR